MRLMPLLIIILRKILRISQIVIIFYNNWNVQNMMINTDFSHGYIKQNCSSWFYIFHIKNVLINFFHTQQFRRLGKGILRAAVRLKLYRGGFVDPTKASTKHSFFYINYPSRFFTVLSVEIISRSRKILEIGKRHWIAFDSW